VLLAVLAGSPPPPRAARAQAGPDRTPRASIVAAAGQVVSGVRITSATGPCITVADVPDVVIHDVELGPCGGPGVRISGRRATRIRVTNSVIHTERSGRAGLDTGAGVYVGDGASTVLVQGNVIERSETNVFAIRARGVRVIGNYLRNPLGPFPRGTQVQFGWVTGGEVSDNFGEVVPERATAGEHQLEDHINMYASRDIRIEGNYLRGGRSRSGCGITLGDGGRDGSGANWTARRNTLVRTGNCGIGIGGGTNAVVDGNRVLDPSLPGGQGNVGIYIWDVYGVGGCAGHTVTNNVVSNRRPEGVYADIYDARTCGPVTMGGNVTGDAARKLLTPEALQLPAPAIPPKRYVAAGGAPGPTPSPVLAGRR
jgi:hypothetical protein